MNDPVELTMDVQKVGNENIDHQYTVVTERDKYLALKRHVDYNPGIFGVIFCRTKIDTQKIAEHLIKDGYSADALHGDLSQQQRDRVMRSFKNKALQLLVATDVAARGIDVSNISHVIHMNMPDEMEFYTHRSGRTARAGKKGISLAIVSKREIGRIQQVERGIKRRFTKVAVPTGNEVCQKKLLDLTHRVREVEINEAEMDYFLPEVFHELQSLTKEEIIKRFAAIEFNRFLAYYRDAPDLNQGSTERRTDDRSAAYSTGDRVFINVGKMDGLDKGSLLGLICDFGEINKAQIGKIDIKGAYSFFELEKDTTEKVFKGFEGVEVRGRSVRLELTTAHKEKYSDKKKERFYGGAKGKSRPRRRS
jgi:ATP-dependent RNA helicase DeaD